MMQVKGCRDNDNELLSIIKNIIIISYMNGRGVREKLPDGYMAFIPDDINDFQCQCPTCGEWLGLDLKEMLKTDDIIEGGLSCE